MKIKLLFRCLISVAIGLTIALTVTFAIIAVLYDLSLVDIKNGLMKYSIEIAIAYLVMVPLVYIEQVKANTSRN
jgi:hypothetical protein